MLNCEQQTVERFPLKQGIQYVVVLHSIGTVYGINNNKVNQKKNPAPNVFHIKLYRIQQVIKALLY